MSKGNKINLLIGIAIGLSIGIPITFYSLDKTIRNYKIVVGIILSIVLVLSLLLFILLIAKKSILKRVFNIEEANIETISSDLISTISPLISENYAPIVKSSETIIKQIAVYLAYTKTRNWILGIIVSLVAGYAGYLGTVLLIRQNQLIKEQTFLIESSRRSAIIFELSSILDKIDEEIDLFEKDTSKLPPYLLSSRLESRIVALSKSFRPYYYLNGTELINRPQSPERGQLLISLLDSDIETNNLFNKCDFSFADLESVDFEKVNLKRINLNFANLKNANLQSIKFDTIFAMITDFSGANLIGSEFNNCFLNNASFINCAFYRTKFERCILNNADFSNANMKATNFEEASLNNCNFNNAFLPFANFKDAKGLTAKQLIKAKTLFGAVLNKEIRDEIIRLGNERLFNEQPNEKEWSKEPPLNPNWYYPR